MLEHERHTELVSLTELFILLVKISPNILHVLHPEAERPFYHSYSETQINRNLSANISSL